MAYVTSDNPRTEDAQRILDEILPGFSESPACRVEVEADRRRAIEAAISEARPGDTVLIAGKGHEPYQLVGDKVLPFDDVKVARECLQRCTQSGAADASPKRERGVNAPVARASGSEDRCASERCLTPFPSHGDLA